MNQSILTSEVQDFINAHLKTDISKLAFKGSPFIDISIQELMNQLVSKSKCQEKLPTWFTTPYIYYSPKLNIEQTSSEKAAQHKSTIISGNSIIDLTGGFGVDTFYFSKVFKTVTHCEIDKELSEITSYNYKQLKVVNINCINNDGISYLSNSTKKFDWIYIDPSRRNELKGKVFRLADCLPDIPTHLDLLFKHTDAILVKVSPFLDINIGIKELQFVKEVHIVAIDNEVKELLFILKKNNVDVISIKTINIINSSNQVFNFDLTDENYIIQYSLPLKYIYEPNKAIFKSGAFNLIAEKFNLYKLANNTHLYTSENAIGFPGSCYEVLEQLPYNFKKLKAVLPDLTANIKIRNFPDTINAIKKKLKIRDGGIFYVFFITNKEEKPMILVTKRLN
ncbi:MAG: class I SAM-dependent methyltransferase [Flavobacteriaceae bacterium]|nr:class I SAM-dependent methyltransferase [Flavobacteriaceae bacterium]